ncbi:MAG: acyl carrier protein [Prosthecobacter sp.]|jgi:acyl carrier protein|nr:acyl carrier protein [Prosthecobacter sp.]
MSDTATTLLEIIQENVPDIQIDPATDGDRLLSELGIDSLDKMSILLAVQEKWDCEFTPEEIAELTTLNALCKKLG